MLSFVGLGISGFESIPIEGLEAISKADIVYLEQFTSPIGKSDVDKIQKAIKGEFIPAKRWLVEDGKEILEKSKEKNVVLLAYGDPYIATTHIELRTRAIELKIETRSIHASSSLTSMIGECGLHFYKVGKIATIMSEMKSLTYPYYIIYKNIIEGNHTVLLLEYNQNKDFFLDPKDALKELLETEEGQDFSLNLIARNLVQEDLFYKIIIDSNLLSIKRIDIKNRDNLILNSFLTLSYKYNLSLPSSLFKFDKNKFNDYMLIEN